MGLTFCLCFVIVILGHSLSLSLFPPLPPTPSPSLPLSLTHFSHKVLCRCDSSLKIHSVTDNLVYVLEQIHSYRKFISCNQEVLVSDHSSYLEELRTTGKDLAGLHTVKAEERVTVCEQLKRCRKGRVCVSHCLYCLWSFSIVEIPFVDRQGQKQKITA